MIKVRMKEEENLALLQLTQIVNFQGIIIRITNCNKRGENARRKKNSRGTKTTKPRKILSRGGISCVLRRLRGLAAHSSVFPR